MLHGYLVLKPASQMHEINWYFNNTQLNVAESPSILFYRYDWQAKEIDCYLDIRLWIIK